MSTRLLLRLSVNGEEHELAVAPQRTLLEALREDLDLTGTKHGRELGECGACTVLVDGEPRLSCLTLAVDAEERDVTTVEGLASAESLHPLQVAFAELSAAQCGYCTRRAAAVRRRPLPRRRRRLPRQGARRDPRRAAPAAGGRPAGDVSQAARRASIDFPLLGVAAAVRLDEDGTCAEARIALGAVASLPFRVPAAEELLVGRRLEGEAVAEAAAAAAAVAKPMQNTDLTPAYRKRMVRVFVAWALSELA